MRTANKNLFYKSTSAKVTADYKRHTVTGGIFHTLTMQEVSKAVESRKKVLYDTTKKGGDRRIKPINSHRIVKTEIG